MVHMEEENLASAIACVTRAIQNNPRSSDAYMLRGQVFQALELFRAFRFDCVVLSTCLPSPYTHVWIYFYVCMFVCLYACLLVCAYGRICLCKYDVCCVYIWMYVRACGCISTRILLIAHTVSNHCFNCSCMI
jgi:hypothetical protein